MQRTDFNIDFGAIPEEALLRKYLAPVISEEINKPDPERSFLSVIIRTQGKRNSLLRETLLSLAGQSDEDFEIILAGHKLNDRDLTAVENLAAEQPPFLREKIKLYNCLEEGRSAILNYAFEHSNGRYISVLDDDDYALDNWVEKFHEAEKEHNGNIFHSYALIQSCEMIEKEGIGAPCTIARPIIQPCEDFDYQWQLIKNKCPFNSFAFPRFVFFELGMRFDPELEVVEDWDFLMRTVVYAGVYDIREVTTVYRKFINNENSCTNSNNRIWENNEKKVRNRLADYYCPQKNAISVSNSENITTRKETEPDFRQMAGRMGVKNAFLVFKSAIKIYLSKSCSEARRIIQRKVLNHKANKNK